MAEKNNKSNNKVNKLAQKWKVNCTDGDKISDLSWAVESLADDHNK